MKRAGSCDNIRPSLANAQDNQPHGLNIKNNYVINLITDSECSDQMVSAEHIVEEFLDCLNLGL